MACQPGFHSEVIAVRTTCLSNFLKNPGPETHENSIAVTFLQTPGEPACSLGEREGLAFPEGGGGSAEPFEGGLVT